MSLAEMTNALLALPTDFDRFAYVAFKEISSIENTRDSIDSGKKIKLLYLYLASFISIQELRSHDIF